MKKLAFAVAALLLVSVRPASAVPELPSTEEQRDAESLAQWRAAVAEMRATLLRPGQRVDGWDVGGANPDAELRTRGADRHYYVSSGGGNGTTVGILSDRPISDFVPRSWRVVDTYGTSDSISAPVEIGFQALTPRFVMAARGAIRRVNDVDCFAGITQALLFEVPDAPARSDDEMMRILFRISLLALEGQTICTRSDGDPEHGYRFRYFLPDGHALPEMTDPNEITRIVPAAPVDQLIVAPAPLAVEAPGAPSS
jgi:hypothetical protein